MFLHTYKYRLKAFIRSKLETFWTFFFPIILCTCFAAAFGNISEEAYIFKSIPVAVVYESNNIPFKAVLEQVAADTSSGEEFLTITETDMEDAKKLLDDDKVDAVIVVSDDISMMVSHAGINQTAVQTFLSTYLQKEALYKELLANETLNIDELMATVTEDVNCIKEENMTKENPDPLVAYYFSLIAMAILFGGYIGSKCGREMNGNTTGVGIRKCISPVPKIKLILAEFLATFTIHIAALFVLLIYMLFILKLDIGNQFGYIALTCFIGSLFGISTGIFWGTLPFSEDVQTTLVTIFSLVSSFLSGLMVHVIKIYIEEYAPIVNKINPATIIQDALYSLMMYDTHERYFENMTLLFIYAVVMILVSVLLTRRNRYANL